jgi:hypothetical protein
MRKQEDIECRLFSEKTSRRAREDARNETKKAGKEVHDVCKHGITKCRICNPPTDKVDHRGFGSKRDGMEQDDT